LNNKKEYIQLVIMIYVEQKKKQQFKKLKLKKTFGNQKLFILSKKTMELLIPKKKEKSLVIFQQ